MKKSFEDGRATGLKNFYAIEEYKDLVRTHRFRWAKDFLESATFEKNVDGKAFEESMNAWNKFIAQVCKVGGFKEDFDVSHLDLTKDENLEEYPAGEAKLDIPQDNEFIRLVSVPPLP